MNPAEPGALDRIIADYLQAAERGQAPEPASWITRHPNLAAELLAFLADLGRFGAFLGLPRQPALEATTDLRSPVAGPDAELLAEGEGERFGEYELIRVLGQGGMGTVYEARLAGTSLRVALKVFKPAEREGAEASRQLREEVENTASLRHPNIVPIYHVGEHAGQPFYTMELIEAGSLDQYLDRYRGRFAKAARLLALTARAVHHAHQRRILHRDLKPGNILLDAAGEPPVADFGLAPRLDDTGTATDSGPPAGSLPWMAPEAVRGEPTLSTAIDVWALGVILYELLTTVAVLLLLGLPRLILGLEKGKPVAFLVLTMVVGAVLSILVVLARLNRLTRRGKHVLQRLRAANRQLCSQSASERAESAGLAVALFGPSILTGSLLAPLAGWYPRPPAQVNGGGDGGAEQAAVAAAGAEEAAGVAVVAVAADLVPSPSVWCGAAHLRRKVQRRGGFPETGQ